MGLLAPVVPFPHESLGGLRFQELAVLVALLHVIDVERHSPVVDLQNEVNVGAPSLAAP